MLKNISTDVIQSVFKYGYFRISPFIKQKKQKIFLIAAVIWANSGVFPLVWSCLNVLFSLIFLV